MNKRIGINILMTISNSKIEHCNIVYYCILYTFKAIKLLSIEVDELLRIIVRPVGNVKYQAENTCTPVYVMFIIYS